MTVSEAPTADYIGSIPLFGGIGRAACDYLRQNLQRMELQDGEVLYPQGERAQCLYIIWKGAVACHRDFEGRAQELMRLGAGTAFGERGLVDMQPRHFGVRAEGELILWRLDYDVFTNLQEQDLRAFTIFALNCARQLSRRLIDADHSIAQLKARATGS